MSDANTYRLLEEILAQLKEVNLNLEMIQVGLVGPEEALRIRKRATENPHALPKKEPEKLPRREKEPLQRGKAKQSEGLKKPPEGVF